MRVVILGVFKDVKWLKGIWNFNKIEGIVVVVEVGLVLVNWIIFVYILLGVFLKFLSLIIIFIK